ncbi:TIGR04076 family protein [Desulfosporosinus sp. FKA]|uniref:TIGR04076 family protein n=1 Tax=Desulfosporosinus sp. FKA TaxID=1969834 RepID=UPI000B497516|nr:TIGR04076 family protein [Desulfosporosinus sp. FKA]
MRKCKITVLKKTLNYELAQQYCEANISTCPCLEEGQEFIAGFEKPQNFCDWAWNDIHKYVVVLLSGGNFSTDAFEDWMKDDKSMIACCTDGIRPVVFKLEKIDC